MTLALVKNEIRTQREADEFTRLTFRGDIDQILAVKEPIELKDIFNPEEKTRLVLVEGAPGIGKSTLALELCHQWQKRTLLQQFSLVILLILREQEVFTATGIRDLFPHYYKENLRDEVVDEVIRNIGEGVLFIFDGFDELPSKFKKESFISEMIRRSDLFPKATIMVTSRPSASAELQPLLETTFKRIEIVGFKKDVIMNAAHSAFNNKEMFSNFQTYLKTNPYVEELLYNPLSCAIVVKIYSENFQAGRTVPQTLTQLYTEFTMYLISRHFKEKGEESMVTKLPNTLEGFRNEHEDIYQELLNIGRLANKGWFMEFDVFDGLHGNGTTDLGLLIEYRSLFERSEIVRYTFFHRTLQEFMVAFHISQYEYHELLKDLFKIMLYPRNYVILTFYAGLTKMKYVGWDALGTNQLIFQSFFEANDIKECNNAFGQKVHTVNDKCSSPNRMYSVGYVVSLCNISLKLTLSHITESALEMLNHGLKHKIHGRGSISYLLINSSHGILNNGGHWLEMPLYSIKSIEKIFFLECDINNEGFKALSLHIPKFKNLKVLDIQGGSGSLVNFLKSLKTLNKLEHLSVEDVEMGKEDILALSNLIVSSSKLVLIAAGGWATSTIEMDTKLANTLLSPSTPSIIKICFMSHLYNNSSIFEYIDAVSNNIMVLNLYDVSQPNTSRLNNKKGIVKFMNVLRNNTSLIRLDLAFNFNDDEIGLLILLLNEHESLKLLRVYHDGKILILSYYGNHIVYFVFEHCAH